MDHPISRMLRRRHFLQVGSIGCMGLSLPQLLRAEPLATPATADSCILIFLNGGPSHLDMWDMKPGAPAEVRGEFKPIASSLPGVQFSEHLPRMAKLVHRSTIIRSAHHSVNNAHAAAVYAALTGHDRGENGGGTKPTDYPAIGSVVGQQRPPKASVVPYASLPFITKEGAGGPPQPGFFGGLLGRTRDPLWVLKDPNAVDFGVPELTPASDVPVTRLGDRRDLLREVTGNSTGELDAIQQKAFDLLTAPATQRAFQLEQESAKTRDAYGRNIYGQSVLLARRLIEAGTRVACISWAPDANATWDTHGNNFVSLKTRLLPQLDAAVSSLLDDLIARGMFERTLVVVMGEFGRSPKVNAAAGRDHWNFCYGLMMAGGGIRNGHVFGASDKIGGRPSSNPVTPADIVSTIYHCMGVSKDLELRDNLERPFQLVPWGDVIRDVLI
ncbi:MAG: DUF1501 domain-containing protein [Gemmataceae bacterium]|nr:DUF1501 domain-containing protein [Gemmataceae bacterium]